MLPISAPQPASNSVDGTDVADLLAAIANAARRSTSHRELLQSLCEAISEFWRGSCVAIWPAQVDTANRPARPIRCTSAGGNRRAEALLRAAVADALRTRNAAVLQDPYLGAVSAAPLLGSDEVWLAVLTVHLPKPEPQLTTSVLRAMADVVALAWQRLEWRDRHAALADRTDTLLQALEACPLGVMITDASTTITYCNPALVNLTGFYRSDLIGKSPRLLASGKTQPAVYRELWQRLRQGQAWSGEFCNRHRSGREIIHSTTVAPLRNKANQLIGYIGFSEDLNEIRKLAMDLAASQAELEGRVALRTQELREAQHRAEVASRVKSAFLANMSHELRTPLNAILAMITVLLGNSTSTQQRTLLETTQTAARRLSRTLLDILAMADLDAGQLQLTLADFSLAGLLSAARDGVAEQVSARGLALSFDIDPSLPDRLRGDSEHLAQIIGHLLDNAIKFTDRGSIAVAAQRRVAANGEPLLRLEVADSGRGFDPDHVSSIFRLFEQEDTGIDRAHQGVGLGLTIVAKVAELLGGRVGADNNSGSGSTFWIEIPLVVAPVEAQAAQAVPLPARQRNRDPQTIRVLVADDDSVSRELLQWQLTSRGIAADLVEDGEQAVLAALHGQYDLVILDLQMPKLGGFEVARALRRQSMFASLPILGMSVSCESSDLAAAADAGMNGLLSKPLRPETTLEQVGAWTGVRLAGDKRMRHPPHLNRSDPLRARLDAIAGMYPAAGLQVVDGQWNTYLQLLKRFLADRGDTVQRIRDHLAKGGWREALREVHTLKGVAASLGAEELRVAAAAVENALQGAPKTPGEFEPRLAVLAQVHDHLLAQLHEALPQVPASAPAVADTSEIHAIVKKLLDYMDRDDIRALSTLREEAPKLQTAMGGAYAEIAAAIERFDFEGGHERLLRWQFSYRPNADSRVGPG